jgi:DNA-binding MarR family transcriptional regulator
VQRLEKRGLVSRERSTTDARVVLVHLTDLGHDLIEPSFEAHAQDLNKLFDVLDESERTQFANLIRKVGQRAEQL